MRIFSFFLSAYLQNKQLMRAGCFLNTIGRKGGGPGEYAEMSSCFLGKDCLFVDDLTTRRIFRYKPDGTFARSISFPFNVIYEHCGSSR